MQTAQMSTSLNYPPTVPLLHTLDDYRMFPASRDPGGSSSAKSMRPLLIIAVIAAAGAGIWFGVNAYSERVDAGNRAAALAANPGVPPRAAVATPTPAPLIEPAGSLTKSQEANPVPLPVPSNAPVIASTKPAKANSSVPVKAASAPAKKVAPEPIAPLVVVVPPPQELPPTPISAPAPILVADPIPAPSPPPIAERATPAPAPVVPPPDQPKL